MGNPQGFPGFPGLTGDSTDLPVMAMGSLPSNMSHGNVHHVGKHRSSALEEFTHHLSGQSPIVFFSWQAMATWWLIPVSKWVITPVISGLTLLIPFITGVITHLLTGMSHQVCLMGNHALRPLDRNYCIFIKENMAQQSINGDTYIVLLRNYQQPAIFWLG